MVECCGARLSSLLAWCRHRPVPLVAQSRDQSSSLPRSSGQSGAFASICQGEEWSMYLHRYSRPLRIQQAPQDTAHTVHRETLQNLRHGYIYTQGVTHHTHACTHTHAYTQTHIYTHTQTEREQHISTYIHINCTPLSLTCQCSSVYQRPPLSLSTSRHKQDRDCFLDQP